MAGCLTRQYDALAFLGVRINPTFPGLLLAVH